MRNHILSCGYYNKSLGIMKGPMGREDAQSIKTKSHKTKGNKSLMKRVK